MTSCFFLNHVTLYVLKYQLSALFVARPLLAFKRDLSRPTSAARDPSASTDKDSLQPSFRTHQGSIPASSPVEIIEIDNSNGGGFKSIFEKVKYTLSPAAKRRPSENPSHEEPKTSSTNSRRSSLTTVPHDKQRSLRLRQHKCVSFAETIESECDDSNSYSYEYSTDDRNEIVRNAHHLTSRILKASIDEAAAKANSKQVPISDDDEFQRDFHRTIKPRRLSIDNMEDLVYQDLSAEIVAYVLKHALRTLRQEEKAAAAAAYEKNVSSRTTIDADQAEEEEEDIIDLK